MLKEHKKALGRIFRLTDLLIILTSFIFVHYTQGSSHSQPGQVFSLPIVLLQSLLTNVFLWIYLTKRTRLYQSRRLSTLKQELWDIVKVSAVCIGFASIPVVFYSNFLNNLIFLIYVILIQICCFTLFRVALRRVLSYLRSRGYNFRQVLVVGCNGRTAKLMKELEASKEFGIRAIGYIDAPNRRDQSEYAGAIKPLGNLEDISRILKEEVVDEVFITLPIKSFYEEIENIIKICETVGVEVKLSTDLFNVLLSKSVISQYLDSPVIDFYTSPKLTWQLMVKRFIDLSLSSALLLVFLPLFATVALIIKATSKGPIFFRQERVGYNGRIFTLYKFRTMVENAEQLKLELMDLNEMDGPVFKIKNDPRITKVGSVLRKTSIDEIPQLFNVFKGEMSLVGPRPPVPSEVTQYDLKDRRRLSIRPGITGVWQVCGRNCIPFEKWMEMDRQYIDEWCLWLDFKILAKTFPALLKGH